MTWIGPTAEARELVVVSVSDAYADARPRVGLVAPGTKAGSRASLLDGPLTRPRATWAKRKTQHVYWATTGLIAALMLWSAINFAFNAEQREAFVHLGLPNWFRWELTTSSNI